VRERQVRTPFQIGIAGTRCNLFDSSRHPNTASELALSEPKIDASVG
jgi:hypothetical protein